MELSSGHLSSHFAVSSTEGSYLPASINAQNLTGDSAESKPSVTSVFTDIDSSCVTSCLLHKTENIIPPAAGEDDGLQCSVVTLSLPGVHRETDNKQLTCVISAAAEVENNCIGEHHCNMICEDDLSVFFSSPVSVSSLSAKLKAVPKRKAKCEHEVTSVSCTLACDEHELNAVNCVGFLEQFVLPLHDALTVNFDKPSVCADIATKTHSVIDNSVCHSSSVQLSLPTSDTSQCHLVHLPTDMSCNASSSFLQSSDCVILPVSVSFLSSSIANLVVSAQDHSSSKSSGTGTQGKCHGGSYSQNPLQMLVKHSCANNQRFLYPSATQVYISPVINAPEHCSNHASLFQPKRSRSLLYRTPDVFQSGCMITNSKAEEHMKKAVSILNNEYSSGVKEMTVDDHYDNTDLISSLQVENSLLAASNFVSCGLKRVAVTGGRNVTFDVTDVNQAYVSSSMPECAVIETYCYRAEKGPSQGVSTESVTALQSFVGVSCCSKLMCDFSGQTSPTVSSRCDVGVQTSLKKLASEDASNISKQLLFVNAAVQTVPVCCSKCSCSRLSQLYKNRHCDFDSQRSNLLQRYELWQGQDLYDTGCMTNVSDVSCKSLIPNMDMLFVSEANLCESRCPFHSLGRSGDESAVESHYNASLLCCGETKTVSISNELMIANNTACISTAVKYGNRNTVTVSQGASPAVAPADRDLGVPQCVISNESSVNCFSAEFLSSVDAVELHATECETSADKDKDLNCLKMLTDDYAQVSNDISLKSTNVSLPKSFSTGFISAGGKPLNVKLSSKRNACKLLDDLGCTEAYSLKNATDAAHFSSMDYFSACSGYGRRKVIQDMDGMDTSTFQCITSGLVDTRSGNVLDCRFIDRSLNSASKTSEPRCDQSCDATYQESSSSSNLCFGNRVADVMCSTANQFTDSKCTVSAYANVNADSSVFNCVGMLHKSKDTVSNGFKPFKAPRTSMMSEHVQNRVSTETDDECLPGTIAAQSHSLKSEDKVNTVDGAELCDLTRCSEVVDVPLFMLNSAELFAMSSIDDVNELAAEKLVSHNSAEAPGSSRDCASDHGIITYTDSVPELCSLVYTMPAANTDRACENLLAEQVPYCCAEAVTCASVVFSESEINMERSDSIQIHNIEQNHAFCLLAAADSMVSRQEHDMKDVAGCCGMSTVSVHAGFADIMPVHIASSQSSYYGEAVASQVVCCKICGCISTSCSCAVENQNILQSFEQTDADDLTHNGSSFVFFSAKGSQINVCEKTLHSVRQNWNSYLTRANSIGIESRTTMKVTDANEQLTNLHSSQDFGLQTNAEEVHTGSVTSDAFACYTEDGSGNCNKDINACEIDENTLLAIPAVDVHSADVRGTSVIVKKVYGSNRKNIHTVTSDDVMSVDSVTVSPDVNCASCCNTTVHVSYAEAAEHRLPFKATNLCSNAETGDDKHFTDRSVRKPLCTDPESKCD